MGKIWRRKLNNEFWEALRVKQKYQEPCLNNNEGVAYRRSESENGIRVASDFLSRLFCLVLGYLAQVEWHKLQDEINRV